MFSEQEISSRNMRGKRERVSPRGIRLVGASKRMNRMREYGVFIPYYDVLE